MEKRYMVWREGEDREDGKVVRANYEKEAVEKWAEWDDAHSADYIIVSGQNAQVFVAMEEEGSEVMKFEVRGESCPVYYATLVSV